VCRHRSISRISCLAWALLISPSVCRACAIVCRRRRNTQIARPPKTCRKTGVCRGVCHRVPTLLCIANIASGAGPAHFFERVPSVCHRAPTTLPYTNRTPAQDLSQSRRVPRRVPSCTSPRSGVYGWVVKMEETSRTPLACSAVARSNFKAIRDPAPEKSTLRGAMGGPMAAPLGSILST